MLISHETVSTSLCSQRYIHCSTIDFTSLEHKHVRENSQYIALVIIVFYILINSQSDWRHPPTHGLYPCALPDECGNSPEIVGHKLVVHKLPDLTSLNKQFFNGNARRFNNQQHKYINLPQTYITPLTSGQPSSIADVSNHFRQSGSPAMEGNQIITSDTSGYLPVVLLAYLQMIKVAHSARSARVLEPSFLREDEK